MDKNSITGIIIIAVILIGYSFFTKPSKEEIAQRQHTADSIRVVRQYEDSQREKAYQADSVSKETAESAKSSSGVSDRSDKRDYGIYSSLEQGSDSLYVLENSKLKLSISKKGGRPYTLELKEFQTWDSLPLILFDGDSTVFGLEFFSDGKHINTNNLYFEKTGVETNLNGENNPVSLVMRLPVESGAFLEYSYTLNPDKYLVDVNVRMHDMDAYRTDNVVLNWEIYSPQQERGRQNAEAYTNLLYRYNEGEVEKFKARSKKESQEANETTRLQWVAYKQQFFASVLISEAKPFEGGHLSSQRMPENSKYINHFKSELPIAYDRSSDFNLPLQLYFGPNNFKVLKKTGYKLEELITLGGSIIGWINRFVIIQIFDWLGKYISSYGIIILLLTVIIKMALIPLTYKSYMSQAKMRALKPEIDEINAKIPKDKAVERQQATMALYKKAGVNPMGGCLPMILQMPILYAMFRFFPASIELRQEKFLWAHDLSTYDSILQLPFTIPMYGDHVSLFTLLMTVTTILSMKMTSTTGGSEGQLPGMKGMMYIMPVMFMLILNNFSAGLTYYYFLANVITLGQNVLFKQFVDEEALRKKLHSRKAKPTKKSGFQKRLEDMAKQRGYNPPKK